MNMRQKEIGVVMAFKEIFSHLPARRKKQFWILAIAMTCVAIFETFAFGFVALFASALTGPEEILNSKFVVTAYNITGFDVFKRPTSLIILLAVGVLLLIPGKNVLRGVIIYWINRFCSALDAFFAEKLMAGILYSNYAWVANRNSADLVLAVNWRVHLGRFFFNLILTAMSDQIVVIALLVSLIVINPIVTLSFILGIGICGFYTVLISKKALEKVAKAVSVLDEKINRKVTVGIHAIKEVKITMSEELFLGSVEKNCSALSLHFGKLQFLTQIPMLLLESLGFSLLSGTVCFLIVMRSSTVSEVIGLVSLMGIAAWRILPAINRLISYLTVIRGHMPYTLKELGYLRQFDNTLEKRNRRLTQTGLWKFENEIVVDNVQFYYSKALEPVFSDLTFTISKGETIGIIGVSGSGKSTLVDLLVGLISPTRGKIAVDGNQISEEGGPSWSEKVGYVGQSPYIMDGTLAENIAFGVSNNLINREKVIDSCQLASIDFLKNLPQGIDTKIGERGVLLSGGEAQRVAIARALFRDPEVIIFDEATSALDSLNETLIQKTISNIGKSKTIILIAHRLTTVADCDRLLWLDEGRLRMIGTPSDVLPAYKKMTMKQNSEIYSSI
jgi:ATP-binding cassette, subfamily B, bacterial PglK